MHNCGHSAWGNSFYNQYLQHHTQMTQWFQQLHQSINPNRGACRTHAQPCRRGHPMMQQFHPSPPCCNQRGRPATRGPRHCCAVQARPTCRPAPPCCAPVPMPQQYSGVPVPQQYAGVQQYSGAGAPVPRNVASSRGCMTRQTRARHATRVLPSHGRPATGSATRRAKVEQAFVEKHEEESDDSIEDEEDYSSSDDELVCDMEAVMVMPKGNDDSDKASEDSFDLVDSVEDEKFKYEYHELDEFGIMQKRYGKRGVVNTLETELLKKRQMEYLYGEKADAICGLETLMSINFDHFTDMNQPILWPVLPLRM